jgi:hypothetical protein
MEMNMDREIDESFLNMEQAKELAAKDEGIGRRFLTSRRVKGTILGRRSERGYPLAELECSVAGCAQTHIRQSCDWHYCDKCEAHAGRRPGPRGPSRLKKVLPTDDAETVALKEEFNRVLLEKRAAAASARECDRAKRRLRAEIANLEKATLVLVPADPAVAVAEEEAGHE